ncbi:MAG: hypothetical protein ACKO8I_19985 [Cyanobacteriota bacterium]
MRHLAAGLRAPASPTPANHLIAGLALLPQALFTLMGSAPNAQARYCIRTGKIIQCNELTTRWHRLDHLFSPA